jgi:hypothetical protein
MVVTVLLILSASAIAAPPSGPSSLPYRLRGMIGMRFVTPSVTSEGAVTSELTRQGGNALDVDDGLVVLERLGDRRAALGAELVP